MRVPLLRLLVAEVALELEGQLVLLVNVVVVVDDHALADQLTVIVTALIPHSSRNFHGKHPPLRVKESAHIHRVVHAQLDHLLQKQEPVVRRPRARLLRFAGVVETVVVLVGVIQTLLESMPHLSP